MNKYAYALGAQVAPRLMKISRRTWIFVGLSITVVLGLLIWVMLSLFSWLWAQTQTLGSTVPDLAKTGIEQARLHVEEISPVMGEKLGELVPVLKQDQKPARDVSGTDFAPVARYPGLARTHWHREGKGLKVEYAGSADYQAVLDHYLNGFAGQEFDHQVLTATKETESHEFMREGNRYLVKISGMTNSQVNVLIETELN